jgi:hypothetical protein
MERTITFIAENKKRELNVVKDKHDNGSTPQHEAQEDEPYVPQIATEK